MEICWEKTINIQNIIYAKATVYKDKNGKFISGISLKPIDLKLSNILHEDLDDAKKCAERLINIHFK